MKLKIWFLETRPQFLLLSVVLAFLGACIAWYDGYFHLGHALLAFFGFLLCHISVNTLNDYFDYRSGIDLETKRTPFSGGSGILPPSLLPPRQVFWFGLVSLLLAIPIGVYFVMTLDRGWFLLPLLLIAAVCTIVYTPSITKLAWPEWAPGIGFGILAILGFYFVQTATFTLPVVIASIPSTILAHNLLLINEFPDTEADRKAGRKTTPITMGKAKASILYSVLTVIVYLWIIGGVVATLITGSVVMPSYCLIALLTIPFAIKAIRASMQYQDMGKLVSAMANNILVTLLTQLLLGVGYILAGVL